VKRRCIANLNFIKPLQKVGDHPANFEKIAIPKLA